MKNRRFLKEAVMILALFLVVLFFLRKGILGKGVFFGADEIASDLLHLIYTHHDYTTGLLKNGQIPLWNPYAGSGGPVLGESQSGIYYPLELIYYFLMPANLAFNWMIISAYLLIAAGTYIYGRSVGLIRSAAFFSSIAFTLSGFMVGHLRHVTIINTVAFMPLMFFVCERLIFRPRLYWSAALAILIYLSFAPGHLTTAYLVLLVLVAYFLVRLWFVFESKKPESLRPIILFFTAIILGIISSAGTILPAVERIKYSNRASFGIEGALSPAYKLKYLLMFLLPHAFGDPSNGSWDMRIESYWENIGYIGILPLVMAALGAYRGKKNGYILGISFLVFLSFLLLLGNFTFFYSLVRNWVPGFSFTRVPGRFLLYIDFFLSILSGFGLMFVSTSLKGFLKRALIPFIVLLAVFDLFHFGYKFNNVMPVSYFDAPETVKFLKKDPDLFRIRQVGFEQSWQQAWLDSGGWQGNLSAYMAQREVLPPDYNLAFGIASPAFIYGMSGRFGVMRSIELDAAVLESLKQARAADFFGMENVKYLLSQFDMGEISNFNLAAKIPTSVGNKTTYIYQNKKWLPRAFLVGKVLYAENSQNILGTMILSDFDPKTSVILEERNVALGSGEGRVVIDSYQDNQVELTVEAKDGGFLVLSDTYYPGWKATIDGKDTKILRADYAYRAVYTPGGIHKVIFSYESGWVKVGAIITFASLLVIFAVFAFSLIKGITGGRG